MDLQAYQSQYMYTTLQGANFVPVGQQAGSY